jgi:hypothetical protein
VLVKYTYPALPTQQGFNFFPFSKPCLAFGRKMKSTYTVRPSRKKIQFGLACLNEAYTVWGPAKPEAVLTGVFFRENRKTEQQIGLKIFSDKNGRAKNLWLVAVTMRKYKCFIRNDYGKVCIYKKGQVFIF